MQPLGGKVKIKEFLKTVKLSAAATFDDIVLKSIHSQSTNNGSGW